MKTFVLIVAHTCSFVVWLFTLGIITRISRRRVRKPYPRQRVADIVPFGRTR